MKVTVEFEDKEYDLDLDEIDVGEARTIKAQTGLGLVALNRAALIEADPDALVAVYWLMQKQNGNSRVDMNRVDFKVAMFAGALAEAHSKALKELEEKEKDAPKDEATKA